jgi:hypothetical protein
MTVRMMFFWVLVLHYSPEDEESMFLQNAGIYQ